MAPCTKFCFREDHREYKSTLVWRDPPPKKFGPFEVVAGHGGFVRVYYYRIWYRCHCDQELTCTDWMRADLD